MQFRNSITRSLLTVTLSGGLLLTAPLFVRGQAAADNSARNQNQATTAEQQSNATSDRQLTAKIRKSLMADKSLSTYAHNVKIITMNGSVTLKGPVKSDDEKQQVASKAAEIAGGPDKVDNQLTVKPQS
jgi:hyperosmotically inducible protein